MIAFKGLTDYLTKQRDISIEDNNEGGHIKIHEGADTSLSKDSSPQTFNQKLKDQRYSDGDSRSLARATTDTQGSAFSRLLQ
jgi:hypothetical protein